MQINLIRTQTYRCFRICSTASLLQSAVEDLIRLLLQNGYPQGKNNKPKEPLATVPPKDVIILLPFVGLHSNHITKSLKSCVNRFYSFVNVKVIFQNTRRINSFLPYKDRLNRSQLSKIIYKSSCRDCNDFYIGKTKRRLHNRKMEHFKALMKHDHSSAITGQVETTGHNTKLMGPFWHFGVRQD